MAKITLDLNKFKASGVYTVEFDSSERVVLTSETVRLVVGFSRKGPFNAPVFLRDIKTARKIFGNIDTFLEKRGSFFHRSIETCLQTGPVFALNLLPVNDAPVSEGGDAVEFRSFSLDVSKENGPVEKDLLSAFYNRERFWFPDRDNLIAVANNHPLSKGKLLHIVNLSQTPLSFIVRKANVQGFAITAREWFGAGNVPEYINENDFIEDYFLEIIAIEGDWTNYKKLSEDVVFAKYFDKRGLKVDKIDEFLALSEVTLVARFTGTIIPDFVDGQGKNHYLETIVNNTTGTTGIFISINRDALEDYANAEHKVDLVGHGLINTNDDIIDFLSYNTPVTKKITYNTNVYDHSTTPVFNKTNFPAGSYEAAYVASMPFGGNSGYFGNVLVVPKPAPGQTVFTVAKYQELLSKLSNISLIKTKSTSYGTDYVKVEQIVDNGTEFRVILSNPEIKNAGYVVEKEIYSVDGGNFAIELDDVTGIVPGSIMYVEAPGFKEYFEIDTVDSTNNGPNGGYYVTIKDGTVAPFTDESMDHSPLKYVAGGEKFAEFVAALGNGTFMAGDVKIKIWLDPATNNEFVPDLKTSVNGQPGFSVVFEPDSVFVHKNNAGDADYLEAYTGSKIAKDILANRLVDGDIVYSAPNAWNYINVDEEWGGYFDATSNLKYGLPGVRIRQYANKDLTSQIIGIANGFVDGVNQFSYEANGAAFNNGLIFYSAAIDDLKKEIPVIVGSMNAGGTVFKIAEQFGNDVEPGYFVVDKSGNSLVRIISKVKSVNPVTGEREFVITTAAATKFENNKIIVFKPLNKFADRLQFTALHGFKLTDYHLPKNQAQLEKIYGVIENTNIGEALASKDIITFRYIVDTMGFGIAPNMGPKAILTRLAKKRQKCLAIINAPSIKEFLESTNPRFTHEPDPRVGNPRPFLNTEYIAMGGNLSLGPSNKFTLPDEENGAKYFGAFIPWLVLRENNKNILVPPAADVSNNFIRKFLNGQPYAIVAGPKRGVLSNPKLVGLEYDFTLRDREFLEPMGLNPIVNVRNVGIMIYGNQSGYQRTASALNNLHVRDLLITIENAIEDILMQYLFEFNDAATRLEIKSIVENYLENVRNAGGIYDYIVIMDETNNTPETIDQNFGILDVGVEPVRGLQKFVNRITILKTGAIASGGFTLT